VVVGNDTRNVHGNDIVKIDGTTTWDVTGTAAWKFGSTADINATGNLGFKTGGNATIDSSGTAGIKAGTFAVDAGSASIKAGSAIKYTPGIRVGGGASSVSGLADLSTVPALEFPSPPDIGVPEDNFYDDLQTPPRRFEEESPFETPDEISTSDGVTFFREREVIGETSTAANVKVEQAPSGAPPILGGVGKFI
jgi:hypothetical protein